MLTISLYLSILLSFSFLIYYIINSGFPDSISGMVYGMKHRYVWSIWMATVTYLMFPSLLEAIPEDLQFTAFWTIFSMCAVATLPLISGQKNTLHYVFGIIAGILTQVDVFIIDKTWLWLWGIIPAVCWMKWFKTYYTLVIELICWTGLMGCLVCELL